MTADCLFCKMVSGSIKPSTVYEDNDVLAFNDINPVCIYYLCLGVWGHRNER